MPDLALLVNPTAGKGRAGRSLPAVEDRLRARGLSVRTLVGRDAADAEQLAREAVSDGVDTIVALGGDGMVHIALQVVAGTRTVLGIVPAGTGNDLALTLGLPLYDPVRAAALTADLLVGGDVRTVDAVRVAETGRWYGCVLGAGFDSRVNDRANRMTWPRGRSRYTLAILAELPVFRALPFTIDLDGREWRTEAMLVAVGNAKSYGAGMRITPDAVIDDGLLDVTVLGRVSKPQFLRAFPRVFKGTHLTHPAVSSRRARVVRLDSPAVTAYADGEYLAELPVTCECMPGALHVLAP
jgi:diacylglycerol kinase (ATP)